MTTGPQDPAATGHDRLRAGHADREQVIETLKDAFAFGRLTKDELDTRAGRALSARTYADLAALTADLPPAPPATWPPRPPAPASVAAASTAPAPTAPAPVAWTRPPVPARRPLVRAAAGASGCLVITALATSTHHMVDPGNGLPPYDAWATPLFLVAAFSVVVALGIVTYGLITWSEQRARRELPPPGPDGRSPAADDRPGSGSSHPALP